MSLATNAQKIDSKKILNDVNKKTKSFKNYKIEFDFTWENKSLEIKENQKGEITIEDKKFKLKIGDQLIINNGKTQWIYLTVISIGWVLGGTIGVATVIFAFGVGPAVSLGLYFIASISNK